MTQCEIILDFIKKHGSITTWDAYEEGITRLPSRIWDLKQKGYNIQEKMETSKNRYGKKVSYKRYTLGVKDNGNI